MEDRILGLHHITAIAGNAKRTLEFYTKILGLRLVKKTVNFDDPGTYHFYFGDERGTPGSILTFFPWEGIRQGNIGTGMATEIGYSVPIGSMEFWADRFTQYHVKHDAIEEKFGEKYLSFRDPDGLKIKLIVPSNSDTRKPWETNEVNVTVAAKGFHSITLMLKNVTPTAKILTDILGYKLLKQEGINYRFATDAIDNAAIIDIIEAPSVVHGVVAAGTNH
ncbi:MAG: ring-cleaving dioxygenase, partial [Ginsengibacter sp.]